MNRARRTEDLRPPHLDSEFTEYTTEDIKRLKQAAETTVRQNSTMFSKSLRFFTTLAVAANALALTVTPPSTLCLPPNSDLAGGLVTLTTVATALSLTGTTVSAVAECPPGVACDAEGGDVLATSKEVLDSLPDGAGVASLLLLAGASANAVGVRTSYQKVRHS